MIAMSATAATPRITGRLLVDVVLLMLLVVPDPDPLDDVGVFEAVAPDPLLPVPPPEDPLPPVREL